MLDTTAQAMKALLKTDPSITPADVKRIMAATKPEVAAASKPVQPTVPLVLSFASAAERTNRSVRSIHQLCRQGLLSKCKLPGRKRAAGVLEAELNTLIVGSVQTNSTAI